MVMEILQIRLSKGLVEKVETLLETGIYANRSDVIRDAVRRLSVSQLVGILPSKKDSVNEIRSLRRRLSHRKFDLKNINSVA